MNGAGITSRWQGALASLRRVTSPPLPLSRWAWTADAILALVLIVGTINDAPKPSSDGPVPVPRNGTPPPPVPPPGIGSDQFAHGPTPFWQLILAVLTAAPLVVRRRYPLVAFWLVIGTSQLYHLRRGFDPVHLRRRHDRGIQVMIYKSHEPFHPERSSNLADTHSNHRRDADPPLPGQLRRPVFRESLM